MTEILTIYHVVPTISACVIYLPMDYKPLAAAVTAFEAFVIFPWWFGVIHLFAIYDKDHHFRGSYLVYPPSSASVIGEKRRPPLPYSLNTGGRGTSSVTNSHTRSMLI